jgi:trimeric autotransporter adhesin
LPASRAERRTSRRVASILFFCLALRAAPACAQGQLTNGWTHAGSIAPAGDSDVWTFSATSGDRIIVRVGEITQTGVFTPRIRLQNPSSVLIAQAASAVAPEAAVTATNAGTFTVIVDDNIGTGTGTYRLTFVKAPGDIIISPGDEGGPMTNGVAHHGLMPPGDLDVWTFTANLGDGIVIKMGQITETNAFDPWIRLYGPDGVLLQSDTGVYTAEVGLRATNSGTFRVVLGNDPYYSDAASASYLLTLAKTGEPIVVSPGDDGGPLTNGVAHTGNLPVGDLDLWSFTGIAGDNVVLRMGQITETNAFDPWIRLYGPDGALLDSVAAVAAAEVAVRLTNTGTFLVVVGNNPYYSEAASASYLLTLAKTGSPITVSPGDEGGPMTNGLLHDGKLPVGDLDLWSFTAVSGDNIVLRMGQVTDTNAFTPWLRLYGPDGALLGSAFAASAVEVAIRATNSGTFLVVVANNPYYNDAGNGTYILTLVKTGSPVFVSAGDEGGPLTNGIANQGTLQIGDLDAWTFTANAGDAIIVRLGEINQTNSFAPWVRLYGPDGQLLGSDFGASVGEVVTRATNNGSFLVLVANNPYYSDAGSGMYILALAKTGEPLLVSAGDDGGSLSGVQNYNGNIPVGDLDLWSFTACVGDGIVLTVTETSQTNSFAPWLRLFSPQGLLIGSSFGATSGTLSLIATNRGSYLLVIGNNDYYNNAGSGTYLLTVNGLSDGLKLCNPVISGGNALLSAVGGTSGATGILYTDTNVATPFSSWTAIRTNQFDVFGVVYHTNPFSPTGERFFRLIEQ